MEWGPPRVRLSVPPQYNVHLLAWGADPAGEWWAALVTWERYMARGFESPTRVWCSAWTSRAHAAGQVENEDYSRVPRVRLDDDRRWWPSPPASRPGYYGVLDADTALDPPVDTAGAILGSATGSDLWSDAISTADNAFAAPLMAGSHVDGNGVPDDRHSATSRKV